MFNIEEILKRPVPADITLGVLRGLIENDQRFVELIGQSTQPNAKIRVRFLDTFGVPCSDDFTLEDFRSIPDYKIVIDDLGGGVESWTQPLVLA